jgi:hypothetical protein
MKVELLKRVRKEYSIIKNGHGVLIVTRNGYELYRAHGFYKNAYDVMMRDIRDRFGSYTRKHKEWLLKSKEIKLWYR